MPSKEQFTEELTGVPSVDIEAALDPMEVDGVYRDSRECLGAALNAGDFRLVLSPPTPRPKKG
ncbi:MULTISPECIES: hypothetical protein [unclassified Streptomyces]|uniref:hypothetical protein n=1 Tax=unclassified Streptomyces TaxID=2593676 RepID=UPI0036EEF4F2